MMDESASPRDGNQDGNAAVKAQSEESLQKADSLAPLEETTGSFIPPRQTSDGRLLNASSLGMDSDDFAIPKNLLEKDEGLRGVLRPEPVVAAIVVFVIIFILFIAYLIRITPQDTPKDDARRQQTHLRV